MSITVDFYDKFEPIYSKNKKYLGTNNSPVIENVKLNDNDKLNNEPYEYNDYEDFQNDLTNNKNIKNYLRDNHYYVKVTFNNSGTYEGQINNKGEFDGIGKDVVINEEGEKYTYIGKWKEGKRNGYGVYTWSNGTKYEGKYKEGKRNGYGVYTWSNGTKYEGDWKNNQREGKGIYFHSDGCKYEGVFYNDQKAPGKGKITWKDGSTYEGDFNNHGESSTGTLTIDNSPQPWNFPMSNINIYCKPPKKICKIPFTERTHLMKHQPSKWSCCNYSCVEETREPEKNLYFKT